MKFHDGSVMTSRDVKASYDRIVNPPAGVTSYRNGNYRAVETASFLITLASPYSWIYKADLLAKDQQWYARNVIGSSTASTRTAARCGDGRSRPPTS